MGRQRAARGSEDERRADQRAAVPQQLAVAYQELQATHKARQATNTALQAENARLQERVAELERRLSLDSTTGSQPPSSDGPRKPPARRRTSSLRGESGRQPGGQQGHKGSTLQRTDQPNHVRDHWPQQCSDCGAPLEAGDATGQPVARQVFDLPEPQPPEVTEHRAHACRCAQCGSTTRAEFPEGVQGPVQYGPRLAAVVVYLQCAHFLPERRLAQWLQDRFGVSLCAATAARMTRTLAECWRGFTEQVPAWIRTAVPVKHLDETGYRIRGRTQWLHVLSTPLLTFYRTSAKRARWGRAWCMTAGSRASGCRGVVHALCNAHILRELQALVKIDQEDWAVRIAQRLGVPLPDSLLERIRKRCERLVKEGLAYHRGLEPLARGRRGRKKRRPGHNLALRLRDRQADVLRFLTDFAVPFTNNLAEQDLRIKISGCFRWPL